MKRRNSQSDYGWIFLGFALFEATAAWPAESNLLVAPAPDWIRALEWSPPARSARNEKSEATSYLLIERQQNALSKEEYTRNIVMMENETGVQESGNLFFHFDPAYQTLTLHRIQIHRAGRVLDRLDASKFKVIQPEPGLAGDVFTGDHTALLFVEDLRVGDVLEYAYTKRGANPILGGHYSARFVVQSPLPVQRQRIRVVAQPAQPLFIRQHLTGVSPAIAPSGGHTEYVWDFAGLEPMDYEDCLPVGFEPFPYVELSDFDNWARVVEWALPLYSIAETNPPPDLQQLMNQWRADASTEEEMARLALQFVQDDLRYTGLELGPDSYRPAHPFDTFEKRFGDCKGKALLYCTILRAMQMEAWPALVNTSVRDGVARRLPSPFAFDHVIVKAKVGGRTIWVDPTLSHQGGRLENRSLSPLGQALVVQLGTTMLEEIPPSPQQNARQSVTSTFNIRDYELPVSFTVKTTSLGSGADGMRRQIARTDLQELSREYLNFYARFYPGVEPTRPLDIFDDRANNAVTITESYLIKDLWKLDQSTQIWKAQFYADSLQDVLPQPSIRLRKMPLGLPFPLRRDHEIIVQLPDSDWNIPDQEQTVDHEAFLFRYRRKFSGSVVRFQYECATKVRELGPEKVAGYLKKLGEMEDLLGDSLQRPGTSLHGILAQLNWLMIVVSLFGVTTVSLGSVWYWRATRAPPGLPPVPPAEPRLQGLGGWLVLVGLGISISPLIRIAGLAQNWESYFSLPVWHAVTMPQSGQYHSLYGPLLVFEVLGNTLLIGLNVLVMCLFFDQRRVFPKTFIVMMVSTVAFLAIDEFIGCQIPLVVENSDGTSSRNISRAILSTFIWTAYMLKSRRVKATFIR